MNTTTTTKQAARAQRTAGRIMTMTAPSWATKADRAAVRKWASWEEYMNHETVLTYYQL